MHRTKPERIKDDLIGEAVFSLLKENAPVNLTSLADRLHRMAENESEHERRRALTAAVEEVSPRIKDFHLSSSVIPGDCSLSERSHNTDKRH